MQVNFSLEPEQTVYFPNVQRKVRSAKIEEAVVTADGVFYRVAGSNHLYDPDDLYTTPEAAQEEIERMK